MTILFAGGELSDFILTNPNGNLNETSTTSFFRGAYARRAVTTASPATTDYVETPAWTGTGTLWLSFFFVGASSALNTATTVPFLVFLNGSTRKLGLEFTSTTRIMQLVKWTNSGTKTVLQTMTAGLTGVSGTNSAGRFTVEVSYAASGRVRVFYDGTVWQNGTLIDYSGDPTTDGTTTLTGARFGQWNSSSANPSYYSEIIVADTSTRQMSLFSIPPTGAGDVNDWSGAYTDVDETPASSTDTIASATASQVFTAAITAPTVPQNHKVSCVKVAADALREVTGPQNLSLGVRQSATNGFASPVALDTAYGIAAAYLQTNPVTSSDWGTSLTGVQLALRSET